VNIATLVLEDQVAIISRKIRLCILSAEGKLAHIAQMLLERQSQRGGSLLAVTSNRAGECSNDQQDEA
jgi:hypothetical protein